MFIMRRATFVMSKGDAAFIDGRFVCGGDGSLTGDDRPLVRPSAEFHSKDISPAHSLAPRRREIRGKDTGGRSDGDREEG